MFSYFPIDYTRVYKSYLAGMLDQIYIDFFYIRNFTICFCKKIGPATADRTENETDYYTLILIDLVYVNHFKDFTVAFTIQTIVVNTTSM